MSNIKEMGGRAARYLRTRGIAFWLLVPVVILSFVVPFVYLAGFGDKYFAAAAVVLPFLAIPVFAAAFFRPAARYAAVAMYVLELVSLLVFVQTTYMHLSTAFFNGIEGNVLVQAGFHFSFCTLVLLINMALSAAAAFFKQFRDVGSAEPQAQEVAQ